MASLDGKICFLDLPPELRNLIYKLVLPTHQRFGHRYQPALLLPTRQSPRGLPASTAPPIRRRLNRHELPGFLPGLLLASQQIRQEAAQIFFHSNEVQINAKLNLNRLSTLPTRLENDCQHAFEFVKDLKLTIKLHIKPDERAACDCIVECAVPVITILITLSKGQLAGDISWTTPTMQCPQKHWWPQVKKVWKELREAVRDALESTQTDTEIRDATEFSFFRHRGCDYSMVNVLSKGGWPRRRGVMDFRGMQQG